MNVTGLCEVLVKWLLLLFPPPLFLENSLTWYNHPHRQTLNNKMHLHNEYIK